VIKDIDLRKYVDFDGIIKEIATRTPESQKTFHEDFPDSSVMVCLVSYDFHVKMLEANLRNEIFQRANKS